MTESAAAGIREALEATGMSRRELAQVTGISYGTLARTISGDRTIKMPEAILIARATGRTVDEITQPHAMEDRLECVGRSVGTSNAESLRRTLTHYFEIADYLDLQAIA